MMPRRPIVAVTYCLYLALAAAPLACGQAPVEGEKFVRERYTKDEQLVPMRDGVKLFTSIYVPKNQSKKYPILLMRTPYSVRPYGKEAYRSGLGPSHDFEVEGYIFVFQDVRGCYMSEGQFENMRPHLDKKATPKDIDESSDTYDTIEWLVNNVPNHNGRVGQWGISYPGFYSSAGMIDAHPALRAVSPQAPVSDFYFDDFHHHGAFFLPHAFNFYSSFGYARTKPTKGGFRRFDHGTPDGYQFFLDLGPLKNVNEKYFKGEIDFWNKIVEHPDYDTFWQARNILPHLKKVAPAVMTVGGWFDAEDLYGPLNTYRAIEKQNPGIFNVLVMGPWRHGGWNRTDGDRLGNVHFGDKTARYYQKNVELPFFEHFLKDMGENKLPEATVFETGVNRWRQFDAWPPKDAQKKSLYLHAHGKLAFDPPVADGDENDEYVSDPSKPVPFTEAIDKGMTVDYMTDDQRFAARRPDVLAYQTDVLTEDVTLAGPILADLRVSTSGTDSDWVVKLIDVFPPNAGNYPSMRQGMHLGGYQMMVRSEVIRGRYRNSYEKPEPFVANEPTKVALPLQDVLHTFQKGHRIMVQVQSTWFPLVDRNPQKYVPNIFMADANDFVKATQRVYRNNKNATRIEVGIIPTQSSGSE
jgi:putative CocE/NonD family hydrolase